MDKNKVTDIFASSVFNDTVMRARLPKEIYKSLKKTADEGSALETNVAQVVANAMKDWAIEQGATHYTHWFQPMTGITAEKHDAFISPSIEGKVFMEFSGKELIKGEPDASSFPSGGLRSTFEARGYTAWDPTSYAFVKDRTLYIPTAFCSYSGEALDKKTPLIRSMEALNIQALRALNVMGNPAKRVTPTVGAEQEYFLIDKAMYNKRKDIMCTGRTLFGANPPKGQELDDHYFGNLKDRVADYMRELDYELWKLGVYAKTKHNEVAPAQHELACIFTSCNLASDHNQLVMELMKKIASRHNLVCLLHEKPFAGVNGSGKHNNWSMSTDAGENLLEPGRNPEQNTQFIVFLTAVVKAVNQYSDLLRQAVASAGNDCRLGGNEAPPAIVSVFLGDELTHILESMEKGEEQEQTITKTLATGVTSLPNFKRDSTDRNRTSPFAFTGNKFEFRMLGSADSISCVNVMLNTMVAEVLSGFADQVEGAEDTDKAIEQWLKKAIKENKRIIFNGNNYAQEWVEEAQKRGLENLPHTVDALPCFIREKNLALLEKHHVFSREEVMARYEIFLENYSKTINIEAKTMSKMAKKDILPAAMEYSKHIADIIQSKKAIRESLVSSEELDYLECIATLCSELIPQVNNMDAVAEQINVVQDPYENALYCQNKVVPAMAALRSVADQLETILGRKYWPYPTYNELLFSV